MTDKPTTAPFDAEKVAADLVQWTAPEGPLPSRITIPLNKIGRMFIHGEKELIAGMLRQAFAAALQSAHDTALKAGAEQMRGNVVASLKLVIATHERNSHRWALSPQEVLQVAVDALNALPLTPDPDPTENPHA